MALALARFRALAAPFATQCSRLATASGKPIFFDMVHSNNAARIRIWRALKGLEDVIETKMVTYADLQDPEFEKVNPLKKVPGFITADGQNIFESFVIMEYLDDKYGDLGPSFTLQTPERRATVNLFIRIHDLYISSPNCTQPNFAHTQGAMYLPPYETQFSSAARAMDRPSRAAKLAEIWKQLTWLEEHAEGPYLVGGTITNADMTWFPTVIFMEFMLPRVFGWPDIFNDPKQGFPKLAAWFALCKRNPVFAQTRQEIWDFWVEKEKAGQFLPILDEIKDPAYKWVYP